MPFGMMVPKKLYEGCGFCDLTVGFRLENIFHQQNFFTVTDFNISGYNIKQYNNYL